MFKSVAEVSGVLLRCFGVFNGVEVFRVLQRCLGCLGC